MSRTAPDPRSPIAARVHRVLEGFRYVCGTSHPSQEIRLVIDVGDPAWEMVDCPLVSAADELVAPHECGMCDLWECNLTHDYAIWARRAGPYVVWIYPGADGRVRSFDAAAYDRAFSLPGLPPSTSAALKVIDREETEWRLGERNVEVPQELRAIAAWPDRALTDLRFVAPPPAARELPELDLWLSRVGANVCAYAPRAFALPVWFSCAEIDAIASTLVHNP